MIRRRLELTGRLQGVGFRPLVHRLAGELGLSGSVCNTSHGVTLEVEGEPEGVRKFALTLQSRLPAAAFIRNRRECDLPPTGERGFHILPSAAGAGSPTAEVLPDLAMCPTCAAEFSDPADRRFRYPFINCTDCGPRYSILQSLPFDRERTTMAAFTLCSDCAREYHDPMNRRFHAQAICCPACGPTLTLLDRGGEPIGGGEAALSQATDVIRAGGVVAVLGVGGFHLFCDARLDAPVARLREFKRRRFKPFALMGAGLKQIRRFCHVSPLEESLLASAAAPIVLLDRHAHDEGISPLVAPQLATLGFMLPYSPLHALLLKGLDGPVVATSGNRGEEPLCHEIGEGLARLNEIADLFLVHNRPIAARVDDSVVRVIDGGEMVLRAGRGYTPHVIEVEDIQEVPVLAFGTQQKNSLAFARRGRVVLLPHVGDLTTEAARAEYEHTVDRLVALYDLQSARAACDLHPDYASTRAAFARDSAAIAVQHHMAHALSCAAEHGVTEDALSIAWDGTGYGDDGSVWGGEFLAGSLSKGFRRVGHLRSFALPGGAAAVKEPRRVAFALAFEIGVSSTCASPEEARVWEAMIRQSINAPRCTSTGRLFDGLAALLGLAPGRCDYEGQAAVLLETAAAGGLAGERYPMPLSDALILDWEPCLRAVLSDIQDGLKPARIAAKVHASLANAIVDVARAVRAPHVLLSGGCFQNRRLCEAALAGLREAGFRAFVNRRVPPNDGGVSVGQALGGMHVLVGPR